MADLVTFRLSSDTMLRVLHTRLYERVRYKYERPPLQQNA